MQCGLRHVTARVDEIEDFREFWKSHKDFFKRIQKKKNIPLNIRPTDVALLPFFSYIQSPAGQECFNLCLLNGWPTTEEWKQWEAWWNIQLQKIQDMENHTGHKSATSQWPMQVHITAKLIHQAIAELFIAAAENTAQLNLEKVLWKTVFIQNALTEIGIFPKADEKSWFANLWEFNNRLIQTKPTVHQCQKLLQKILPCKANPDHILYVSTPTKDWIAHRDNQLPQTTAFACPRLRSIPENYRLLMEKMKPGMEDLPSTSGLKQPTRRPKRRVKSSPSPPPKKLPKSSSEESTSDDSSSDEDFNRKKADVPSSSDED